MGHHPQPDSFLSSLEPSPNTSGSLQGLVRKGTLRFYSKPKRWCLGMGGLMEALGSPGGVGWSELAMSLGLPF